MCAWVTRYMYMLLHRAQVGSLDATHIITFLAKSMQAGGFQQMPGAWPKRLLGESQQLRKTHTTGTGGCPLVTLQVDPSDKAKNWWQTQWGWLWDLSVVKVLGGEDKGWGHSWWLGCSISWRERTSTKVAFWLHRYTMILVSPPYNNNDNFFKKRRQE